MMSKVWTCPTTIALCLAGTLLLRAQEARPVSGDPTHSVFGPPQPAQWEFQLSRLTDGSEQASGFNFYRKDQRNKTLFFKVSDNDWNNRNEFRAQEITGGALLFPINDDDRYQADVGATYDRVKDTSLSENAFYTRLTFRPQTWLWLRAGYEMFDGYTAGGRTNPYRGVSSSALYAAAKGSYNGVSLVAVLGQGRVDGVNRLRYGGGSIVEGPWNTFALGGYIKSEDPLESVRTLAVGRWAPFRPDGLPSAVFVWKHRDRYDFQLGGLFYGGNNLFVRPAAIGMTQGMLISSMALRENSELRQGQLMSITDDYRNSEFTLFYVFLSQGIEMTPGKLNHVGFRAIQFFKIFSKVELSLFTKPVIGVFYNQETSPQFDPTVRSFADVQTRYWSFQTGVTVLNSFVFNLIFSPDRTKWSAALSYIYR